MKIEIKPENGIQVGDSLYPYSEIDRYKIVSIPGGEPGGFICLSGGERVSLDGCEYSPSFDYKGKYEGYMVTWFHGEPSAIVYVKDGKGHKGVPTKLSRATSKPKAVFEPKPPTEAPKDAH